MQRSIVRLLQSPLLTLFHSVSTVLTRTANCKCVSTSSY